MRHHMVDGFHSCNLIDEFAEVDSVIVRFERPFQANSLFALMDCQARKSQAGLSLQAPLNPTLQFVGSFSGKTGRRPGCRR